MPAEIGIIGSTAAFIARARSAASCRGGSRHWTWLRIWVAKCEAGAFDDEAHAADLLHQYEAKIAALEIELLNGAQKDPRAPKNALTSVIAGAMVFPSSEDVS